MGRRFEKQYGGQGILAERGRGIYFDAGNTVPADGTQGYAPGCVWLKTDAAALSGTEIYINEGTYASSDFNAIPLLSSLATAAGIASVAGVAAGYKLARGQAVTASAADTVATGLASVVSATATLETDPADTCDVATVQIGNQAGTPAAGSIIIKTWMVTTGGAAGNPTLVAASAFTKKVNWIAVGT